MTEKELIFKEISRLADTLENESQDCLLTVEELSKMGDEVWKRLKQQLNIAEL